jgi:exonuclease III
MRIASWNIAGGHTIKSKKHFDYNEADTTYFVKQLQVISPDVVCLQEDQTGQGPGTANEIAKGLGGYFVYQTPMHDSHIEAGFRLGMAILTKNEFASPRLIKFPNPDMAMASD